MAHRSYTVILAAVFCLVSVAANAYTIPIPERYDHPYKGTLYYTLVDPATAHSVCHSPYAAACMYGRTKNKCWTVFQRSYWAIPQWRDHLFRHEQAHCNGWPWNHPQ